MPDNPFHPSPPASLRPPTAGAANPPASLRPPAQGAGDVEARAKRISDFLSRPDIRAALLQFGISVLQPRPYYMSPFGAIAQAIGQGAQAAGRFNQLKRQREEEAIQRAFEERRVKAEEERAAAAVASAEAAKAQAEANAALAQARTDEIRSLIETRPIELEIRMRQAEAQMKQAEAALKQANTAAERAKAQRLLSEAQANLFNVQAAATIQSAGRLVPPDKVDAAFNLFRNLYQSNLENADLFGAEGEPASPQEIMRITKQQFLSTLTMLNPQAQGVISDLEGLGGPEGSGRVEETPPAPAEGAPKTPETEEPVGERESLLQDALSKGLPTDELVTVDMLLERLSDVEQSIPDAIGFRKQELQREADALRAQIAALRALGGTNVEALRRRQLEIAKEMETASGYRRLQLEREFRRLGELIQQAEEGNVGG